jgi:hypothetical protein
MVSNNKVRFEAGSTSLGFLMGEGLVGSRDARVEDYGH